MCRGIAVALCVARVALSFGGRVGGQAGESTRAIFGENDPALIGSRAECGQLLFRRNGAHTSPSALARNEIAPDRTSNRLRLRDPVNRRILADPIAYHISPNRQRSGGMGHLLNLR